MVYEIHQQIANLQCQLNNMALSLGRDGAEEIPARDKAKLFLELEAMAAKIARNQEKLDRSLGCGEPT